MTVEIPTKDCFTLCFTLVSVLLSIFSPVISEDILCLLR